MFLSLLTQRSAWSVDILFRLFPNLAMALSSDGRFDVMPERHTHVNVIRDALDECPNSSGVPSERERVLQLLKEILDLRHPNIHICVTSRPEIDIRTTLEPLAFRVASLHDQSGPRRDIVEYVKSVVNSDPRMMS